jgi:hypothetical protein
VKVTGGVARSRRIGKGVGDRGPHQDTTESMPASVEVTMKTTEHLGEQRTATGAKTVQNLMCLRSKTAQAIASFAAWTP